MNGNPHLLVLCTGNSCRSQMAEGYLRHLAGDRFNVHSGGTQPQEEVHPFAVQVMAEDDIDISSQRPKFVQELLNQLSVKYLIVVCGGANESCRLIQTDVRHRLFWPFDDPAAFQGSERETLDEFRRIRDEIKERTQTWLKKV